MKAIELSAEITADHAIHLTLPEEAPAGPARVIVLYETGSDAQRLGPSQEGNLDAFLNALPKNVTGRARHDIAAQVEAERTSWEQ
jgi:hypothetical protein